MIRPPEPLPDPPAPDPDDVVPEGEAGIAVVARGGADLSLVRGGSPMVRAHEGLILPVLARSGDSFRVLTPCEDLAWIDSDEMRFVARAPTGPVGSGGDFAEAVVVLDAGHGGPNRGATGPTGLVEADINLDIARRARDLLQTPRSIDWTSGMVTAGSDVPAVGAVWVTRSEGPRGGDIEAGLRFRAELASAAGAAALVSIHNNADPDGPFSGPGSEVLYQFTASESKRLAGIMIEELRRGLGRFSAVWMGDTDAGAKYRLRDDGITDYYGILRLATVPAVIAEGAFITNPSEEALLGTAAFRQAYAEAVYRALVRFITTDDAGSGFTEPYPRTVPAGSGAPRPDCTVSAQAVAGG